MIDKDECNKETIDRIINRSEELIKEGKFSPYSAHEIIVEEYMKQFIIEGNGIIFPKNKIDYNLK